MKESKLRKIVREEIIKEQRRTAARGEEGGYVKLQQSEDGLVLMDVGHRRGSGEKRVMLLPGEAENLAKNLERMA